METIFGDLVGYFSISADYVCAYRLADNYHFNHLESSIQSIEPYISCGNDDGVCSHASLYKVSS